MILAGDIGGTKADLGLFEPGGDARRPPLEGRLEVRKYPSLEALIREFLGQAAGRIAMAAPRAARMATPTRIVFGVAGPVHDNRCDAVNLPWPIDGNATGAALGIPLLLLNDLSATAWGVSVLGPSDLVVLNDSPPGSGSRVLIAAGTGLGESIVARNDGGWVVVPSEGGHADFAPRDPLEDELLVWLRAKYGRVSYERVLSGPGIADLFRFMGDSDRGAASREVEQRFAAAPDPAAVVTETALDGSCERSCLAIRKFVDVFGAEAGNLALKGLALAGVYLGGGIAPRLVPFLTDGRLVRAFTDKGRLKPVLERMPVAVILDPRTGLWGAAFYALAHPMTNGS